MIGKKKKSSNSSVISTSRIFSAFKHGKCFKLKALLLNYSQVAEIIMKVNKIVNIQKPKGLVDVQNIVINRRTNYAELSAEFCMPRFHLSLSIS